MLELLCQHRVEVFNINVHNTVEKANGVPAKLYEFRNLDHNAPSEVRIASLETHLPVHATGFPGRRRKVSSC